MFYIIEKDNSVKALDLKKEEDADVLREFIKEGRPYILLSWYGKVKKEDERKGREFYVNLCCGALGEGVSGLKLHNTSRELGLGPSFIGFFLKGMVLGKREPASIMTSGTYPHLDGKFHTFFNRYDFAICRYYGDGIDGHATGDIRALFSQIYDRLEEPIEYCSDNIFARIKEKDAVLRPILESNSKVTREVRNAVDVFERELAKTYAIPFEPEPIPFRSTPVYLPDDRYKYVRLTRGAKDIGGIPLGIERGSYKNVVFPESGKIYAIWNHWDGGIQIIGKLWKYEYSEFDETLAHLFLSFSEVYRINERKRQQMTEGEALGFHQMIFLDSSCFMREITSDADLAFCEEVFDTIQGNIESAKAKADEVLERGKKEAYELASVLSYEERSNP